MQVRKFCFHILPVFIWIIGILCKMILSLEPQGSDGLGVVVQALAPPLPICLGVAPPLPICPVVRHAPPDLSWVGSAPHLSRDWLRLSRCVWGLTPPLPICPGFGPAPILSPALLPLLHLLTCPKFVYRLLQFTQLTSQIYIFDVFSVLLCSGKEPSPILSVDGPQTAQTSTIRSLMFASDQ